MTMMMVIDHSLIIERCWFWFWFLVPVLVLVLVPGAWCLATIALLLLPVGTQALYNFLPHTLRTRGPGIDEMV